MGGNLVSNILQKIEEYSAVNVQINAQILTATKKSNEILSKEIHTELKKQTSALTQLSTNIAKLIGSDSGDTHFSLFGGNAKMSKVFVKFFEVAKPKKIQAMAKAVELLAGAINKFAESINKVDEKKIELVSGFFTKISKGIALFAITVALAAPVLLIGTLVTLPLLVLWIGAFNLLGKHSKRVEKGAHAIKAMGIGIAILALATAGYIWIHGGPMNALINSVVVGMSVFIMTLPMIFLAKNSKNLVKAAIGMGLMSLSIWLLGMAVDSYYQALGGDKKNPVSMLIATATVAGSLAIMGGAFWLIGQMTTNIIQGAVGLLIGAVALIVVSKAVEMWMNAGATWEGIAMLGATILGLGVVMAAAGAVSSLIIPGALGMLIAAVAIIPLAKGVEMWVKAKASWEDIGMLTAAIVGLGAAMAGWGFVSWLIIPGALAMAIASAGMYAFTKGLVNFKKAKWKEADTDNMLYSMETILTGFVDIFDNLSFKQIAKAIFGTFLLGSLGNSMSNFAQGVAAMAKLQAPEYAVEDGKLVLVGTKPLEPDFAKKIGQNIQVILDAVIDPLARLGEMEGFFFAGPVGNGIKLLGKLGNSMSQFAQGVAAMAKLQAPKYTVKDGELVLESTEPLSPDFAAQMAANIAMMTNALIQPMADLGAQEGLFFSGPVGKGVELLGELGNSLTSFAEGVQGMANLQVPIYEVKDGKLVLKGTKPLDPNFAKKVGENIDMIVSALIDPIKKLGTNAGSWWSDSDFEDGLEMLGKLGEPVAQLGEGVTAFNQLDAKGFNGKNIADNIVALAKGLHSAFDKGAGYSFQQGNSLRYFSETLGLLQKNIVFNSSNKTVAPAVAEIKDAINGIDNKKLRDLNKLMINFNKLALTLKKNFEDIDGILDKLLEIFDKVAEGKTVEVKGTTTANVGGQTVTMPKSIKISNVDEIVESIDALKTVLLGTIDVRIEDGLINR